MNSDFSDWGIGPIEPASDVRMAANSIRQMYVALTEAGFSEDQSLTLTLAMLAQVSGG